MTENTNQRAVSMDEVIDKHGVDAPRWQVRRLIIRAQHHPKLGDDFLPLDN